jgi:uncharacterized protein (UPF0335 family)
MIPNTNLGNNSATVLKQYIEQLEKLDTEIATIREQKSDVMRVAKSAGFDATTIREVIKFRKMSSDKAQERELLFDTYRRALGLLPDFD